MDSVFVQESPRLTNTYASGDAAELSRVEARAGDARARRAGRQALRAAARRSLQRVTLTQWNAWGNRIDTIETTALWRAAEQLAVRLGLTVMPA
jgi:acyl-CoA dehydrogenase